MKLFLPFLMLVLCGCCGSQKANVSLDKRQQAVAKEIVSIEYTFGDALLRLNSSNTVNIAAEINSLSDRLDKISKELDSLGTFPAGLREATLKKLEDIETPLSQRILIKFKSTSLQSEAAEIMAPAVARCLSARLSVKDKAGLLIETKENSTDINTNGLELLNHP